MNPNDDFLNDEEQVTYFGETDARNRRLRFGIKRKDRAKHLYAIGKTGMGKSTLLENLAVQDILNGEGLCFLDPHGKSADLLLEYVPEHRIKDVIYFAPFDMEHPISFNVMEDVGPEQRYLVASGMMSAFKKIWVDAWSARMEYILGNIMLALLEYPGSTLVGVNRMLTDKDFRKEVVSHISDPSVKSFWVNEYANYTEKFAAEAAPAIQNKVGQFVANPLIRNIIGQPKSSFDIRDIMDNRKILIINLSKGRVGEANANLLGSMLITKIYLGAMSRADLSERELEKAPNFYLYVDEFQSFANESFADILSEARKYKLALSIAHQYIEQMTDEVRAAVFGNVGTMVTFRVGAYDAEVLEKEFSPYFLADDIVSLQKYQMYLKLMIDGVTSPPFSASGMTPIPRPEINYTNDILASSRALYAKPRQQVEDELLAWIQKKFGGGGGNGGGTGGSSNGGGSNPGNGGGSNGGSTSGGASRSFDRNSKNAISKDEYSNRPRNPVAPAMPTRPTAQNIPTVPNMPTRAPAPVQRHTQNLVQTQTQVQTTQTQVPHRTHQQTPLQAQVSQQTIQQTSQQMNQQTKAPAPSVLAIQNNATNSATQITRENNIMRDTGARSGNAERAVGAEREQELRKAMSLSYLKTEPNPSKSEKAKEERIPKPENIAALREALLSVMNQEKPKSDAGGSVKNDTRSDFQSEAKFESTSKKHTDSHMQRERVHGEHSNREREHTNKSGAVQRDSNQYSASHHGPTSQKHDTDQPKEQSREQVSEDALKSIFSE